MHHPMFTFDNGTTVVDVAVPEHAYAALARMLQQFRLGPLPYVLNAMRITQALLSGSGALATLGVHSFSPTDLDFYVRDEHLNAFICFLEGRGYMLTTNPAPYEYAKDSISGVKTLRNTNTLSKINVIITGGNPIRTIVEFHSTIVMNFIAWYGIVSLYPTTTQGGVGLITEKGRQSPACFVKYQSRGFKLIRTCAEWPEEHEHKCGVSPACPDTLRSTRDSHIAYTPFVLGSHSMNQWEEDIKWSIVAVGELVLLNGGNPL